MLTIPNRCIRCSRWEGMSLDPWPKGGVLPFPGWVAHFAQVILIPEEWKTAAVCCGYHGTAGLLCNFLVFISSHNSSYICCWWCLVTKLCPTLCDPMDCNLPGSSVHGILRARTLEWGAISFSRGSSPPRDWTHVSCAGRQFLFHWATREAPGFPWLLTDEQTGLPISGPHHSGNLPMCNFLASYQLALFPGKLPLKVRLP